MELVSQIFIVTKANHPGSHQLLALEVNRSLTWGRHQVAFPEAQLRAIGLSHPPHPPIHNEVPPFMRERERVKFRMNINTIVIKCI